MIYWVGTIANRYSAVWSYSAIRFGRLVVYFWPPCFYLFGRLDSAVWPDSLNFFGHLDVPRVLVGPPNILRNGNFDRTVSLSKIWLCAIIFLLLRIAHHSVELCLFSNFNHLLSTREAFLPNHCFMLFGWQT